MHLFRDDSRRIAMPLLLVQVPGLQLWVLLKMLGGGGQIDASLHFPLY